MSKKDKNNKGLQRATQASEGKYKETSREVEEKRGFISGFMEFVREQGVVGLAVGFILGGAASRLVTAFVTSIINPLLGIALGAAGDLEEAKITVGGAELMWGAFVNSMIEFLILAWIVYLAVKVLGLDKLDKKKK